MKKDKIKHTEWKTDKKPIIQSIEYASFEDYNSITGTEAFITLDTSQW